MVEANGAQASSDSLALSLLHARCRTALLNQGCEDARASRVTPLLVRLTPLLPLWLSRAAQPRLCAVWNEHQKMAQSAAQRRRW